MQGFQLTFFTPQDRKHGHTPMAEWLLLQGEGVFCLTYAGEQINFGLSTRMA